MAWSKRKEDTPALARAAARRWKWQWVALDMYLYKGRGSRVGMCESGLECFVSATEKAWRMEVCRCC